MSIIKDQGELNKFYSECNSKNELEGLQTDIVEEGKFELWKYYNIEKSIYGDETVPLELYGETINYSLFKYSNDNEVKRQLVVIPGFSKTSICWTIGRINYFLEKLSPQFSDICIFNLEDLKQKYTNIIEQKKATKYELLTKIGYQLNKIIKHMDFDNISLLGRSAGGALCIVISALNSNVKGLNLACPGFEEKMILDLIETQRKIPVRIGWAKEDTKIPIEKGLRLNEILEGAGFDIELFEISTGHPEDKYNHRIQEITIDNLV
jgi:hypothetical protein